VAIVAGQADPLPGQCPPAENAEGGGHGGTIPFGREARKRGDFR
jgi:hypothetical protein